MNHTDQAAAKVNLCLHVTGRRPDGYHLLDSLVVFATVGDRLTVARAETLTLTLDGPMAGDLQHEPNNIVLKAAHLLLPHRKKNDGAHLSLTKILPVASGIGGGSADAAAALRLLSALWDIDLPPASLAQMALSLGADVPVCLAGTPVRLQGIGETLTPLPPLPPVHMVLVNPRIGVSTPAVFKERTETFGGPIALPTRWADAAALASFLKACRNDLEAPAIRLAPVIATVLEELDRQTACLLARMSGSGATCFGLFSCSDDAENAAQCLKTAHPDWWIVSTAIRTE